MLVKVSEAEGAVLDWMVAKCENETYTHTELSYHIGSMDYDELTQFADCHCEYSDAVLSSSEALRSYILAHYIKPEYSTNWAFGGPIIDRELISTGTTGELANPWRASTYTPGSYGISSTGPTPLIAAMRCYVVSKLGDEVEIPNEILVLT